ncbi:MAG: translation initiation factor IF-2 subunit beta [archaeon]
MREGKTLKDYSEMLENAYAKIPSEALKKERFELPRAESFIEGTKTIVKNYAQILKAMNRPQEHLFKFIAKEIATSANVEGGRLVLNARFGEKQVNDLFQNYYRSFVQCRECKKPDTKIIEQQGVRMMRCEACGAMSPVKKL